MTHRRDLKERAVKLRQAGASYSDIMAALDLSKSTVRYMVRGVQLTAAQEAALATRLPSTAGQIVDPSISRRAGELGGRLAWTVHRKRSLRAARKNIQRAVLAYTKAEQLVKSKLECLFKRSFQKERIGDRVVDFACADVIIEHSTDWGKGVGDMIRRFESIASDTRKKIAFVDTARLGDRRRKRLVSLVDEVRDFRALA